MQKISQKIKNITKVVLSVVLVFGFAISADAATALNNHSLDYDTLRVGNATTNPNSTSDSWSTSVSSSAGDNISFAIYYHNNGSETANNLRVRLSPQSTSSGTSHTFVATVWADNAPQVSGTATVSISSSQSLSYSSSVVWRPNQNTYGSQALPNGQNGSEIFTSNGLLLGNIASGWTSQGNVMVAFRVSNNTTTTTNTNQPTVTTNTATNISSGSATLNCSVNPNGTTNTTTFFQWGTNLNYGNTTSTVSVGSSASNPSVTISGLASNTVYYYRCVASNSNGTVYGLAQSISPSSTSYSLPTVTTYSTTSSGNSFAVLRGYVDPQGNSSTTRWFEWGTSSNNFPNSTTRLNQGSSSSTFEDTVSGLSYNTTYYYRAVAQNSNGTVYGGVQSFTTSQAGTNTGTGAPYVTTNSATNITNNSATLNCYTDPNNAYTTRWFEWGTSTGSLTNKTNTTYSSSSGSFNEYISGLTPNVNYYFRCAAQNSNGITYGQIQTIYNANYNTNSGYTPVNYGTITTFSPAVDTNLATNIKQTGVTLNGIVTDTNNLNTTVWFEYGLSTYLGNKTTSRSIGSVYPRAFSENISNLSLNTTYYYRSAAQNSKGTVYGDIKKFKTNSISTVTQTGSSNTASVVNVNLTQDFRKLDITKTVENLDRANGTETSVYATRGQNVRYAVTAKNTGTLTIKDVKITDLIPDYLEFANAQDNQRLDGARREVKWFVGDLKAGEDVTVYLDMVVIEDAPLNKDIINTAEISTKKLDQKTNKAVVSVVSSIPSSALSNQGATIFGAGLMPNSLLGWMLFIIFILILILILEKVYEKHLDNKIKSEQKRNLQAVSEMNR